MDLVQGDRMDFSPPAEGAGDSGSPKKKPAGDDRQRVSCPILEVRSL